MGAGIFGEYSAGGGQVFHIAQGSQQADDRRVPRQPPEFVQHGNAGLFHPRARLCRLRHRRRFGIDTHQYWIINWLLNIELIEFDVAAQVPDVLPHAGRGAEDRAAHGSLRPALLPVQSGNVAAPPESRHRLRPLLRRHHAQHRPPHPQHQR